MSNSPYALNKALTRILADDFYIKHAQLLCESHQRLTGKALLIEPIADIPLIEQLFKAPFVLLSHDTQGDPVFNFANQIALQLFELSWDEFTRLPSRKSAEPLNRDERQRLLDTVSRDGFIDDYSGVRISSTGKRFKIENATVWNLLDASGQNHGQAACFSQWQALDD